MSEIREMDLSFKTSKRVRRAIVDVLTPLPEQPGRQTMDQLPTDLTMRLDLVRAATEWALREYANRDLAEVRYDIRLIQEDERVFRAETDIGDRLGLGADEVDRVLERALLAVGSLNERFEEMENYNAVTGLREPEIPLLDAKLGALLKHVDPDRQEERLTRVLELASLPDPEAAGDAVNVGRLLEIREEAAIRDFRAWLRTLDDATDAEIEGRVNSVRERIAAAVRGPGGKLVRFAVTTAADILPFGGAAADVALGAVDQFVLDKVLPEPGPVSFLGSGYRSLFEP
jgi:hypothetical protein